MCNREVRNGTYEEKTGISTGVGRGQGNLLEAFRDGCFWDSLFSTRENTAQHKKDHALKHIKGSGKTSDKEP